MKCAGALSRRSAMVGIGLLAWPARGEGRPVQVESFEQLWRRVAELHPDPQLRGVDWQAAHDELLPAAQAARSAQELRPVMRALLGRLPDSHFLLLPSEVYGRVQGLRSRGSAEPGELGLELRVIGPEVVVVRVWPEGPAARMGLRPGLVLASISGQPLAPLLEGWEGEAGRAALSRELAGMLRGPVGSEVELGMSGAETFSVQLLRAAPPELPPPVANLPPLALRCGVERRGEAAVLWISAFLAPVVRRVGEAVAGLRAAGLRRLVIDLRGNPGGLGDVARGVAGYLLGPESCSLGTLQTRTAELHMRVFPRPEAERHLGPLALLQDSLSASSAEILAAGLQDLGRARIFGEPSAGQALPSIIETLPNGDRVQMGVAELLRPGGGRIEGVGVSPDVELRPDRASLAAGRDPALDAALRWLEAQP